MTSAALLARPGELLARLRRDVRRGAPWALRLTVAAVASYLVALAVFPGTRPLLAPLTALLVVQVTPISLLASGLDRVVAVVAGVVLAVGFSALVPLEWWSLGVLVALSLLIGQALRLESNLLEVPISGMLVLGSLTAESAGWDRITETLVGAGVGVVSNLVIPPTVGTDEAGRAIQGLADDLTRLLRRAADEVAGSGIPASQMSDRASAWLGDARQVNHDIPAAGEALLRAEQGRRLNVRALAASDAGPGLRQGLEALEHSAVAVRSMFRAVLDATRDPAWPSGEVEEGVRETLRQLFDELADSLAAFGELVATEARPGQVGTAEEIARVRAALDGLHESRARLHELALADTPVAVAELTLALLSTVKRLLVELDVNERVRRQVQMRPGA